MMSVIRLVLVSVIPTLGALFIYLLFIGDLEGFLGFQMSLPSVASVFSLCAIAVILGVCEVMSLMRDEILPEWDTLKDWYNG